MSLSDLDVKGRFQGNGSTVSFAINFDLIAGDNGQIEVYIRDESVTPAIITLKALTTDYTLTGDPATLVVFGTAPATTDVIFIRRVVPLTQATDYVQGDGFPEDAHEEALDKLTRIVQELNERSKRSIRIEKTDAVADWALPVTQANKYLRINASGDGMTLDDGTTTNTTPTVTGSLAAPTAVTAATGISPAGVQNQIIFVDSNGAGAIDVTANPQIAAGTSVGQRLTLIGTSDGDSIFFETGTGLFLNSAITLENNIVLELVWTGSLWVEVSRNV